MARAAVLRDARPGIKGALAALGPQLLGYELPLGDTLDASLAACGVDKDDQLRSRPGGFHDAADGRAVHRPRGDGRRRFVERRARRRARAGRSISLGQHDRAQRRLLAVPFRLAAIDQ